MIAHVLNLSRWEWFKLRRRWMPWVLLGIVVLITQIALWGTMVSIDVGSSASTTFPSRVEHPDGGRLYLEVRCGNIEEQSVPPGVLPRLTEEERQVVSDELAQGLAECQESIGQGANQGRRETDGSVVLASLATALQVGSGAGVVLITILACSAIGSEYGWGTLRTTLTRGSGRWQFLASKMLTVLLMGAGGYLVVMLAAAVTGGIVYSLGGEMTTDMTLAAVVGAYGRAVYSLVPYIALAALFSVLTSSSNVGVSIAIGYYFAELFLVSILRPLLDWFDAFSEFLLGPSIGAWMEPGRAPGEQGAVHAFLVIAVYALVIGGAAFWLFQRKDVGGAKGG